MRTKKGRGLCLFLAVVLVAELIVGFKYPGYLRNKPTGGGSGGGISVSGGGSGGSGSGGNVSIGGGSVGEGHSMDFGDDISLPEILSAENISVRYTAEEIESAPAASAPVTPENPVAACGGVKVDLKSWNLDEPNDTLIVRTLPTKTDAVSGAVCKCWDISLASGQSEFYSDVCIELPLEEDDGPLTSFMTFNEESGEWEELYSELSEDRTHYRVYTDHFSEKMKMNPNKKYLKGDSKSATEMLNKLFENCLDSDAFMELGEDGVSRMELWVDVEYDLLWDKIEYYDPSFNDAEAMVERLNKDLQILKENQSFSEGAATVGEFTGAAGACMNSITAAAAYLGKALPSGFGWDLVGATLNGIDMILIMSRLYDQANSPAGIRVDTVKQLMDVCGSTLTGMSVGAMIAGGTVAATSALPLAVAGLTVWVASSIVGAVSGEFDSKAEECYDFYYLAKSFKFEKSPYYGQLRKMSSMSAKDYEKLKKTVDKHPLSAEAESWVPALKTLIKLYKDKPQELPMIIDELYEAYAWAYFQMDDKTRRDFETEFCEDFDPKDEFISPVLMSEIQPLIDKRVQIIKGITADSLKLAYEDLQRDLRLAVQKMIKKELLPRLNATVTFHVKDKSLGESESFYGSFYGVDYTKIKQNKELLGGTTREEAVDCSEIITPMAFAGDPSPLFVPLNWSGDRGSMLNYYPYQPNFIPRARKGTDEVYRCTLFHYIMMGCPQKMVFTDVTDPDHMDKADSQTVSFAKIEAPDKKHINITIEVEGGEFILGDYYITGIDYQTLEEETGWLRIFKQDGKYYFESDDDREDLDNDDPEGPAGVYDKSTQTLTFEEDGESVTFRFSKTSDGTVSISARVVEEDGDETNYYEVSGTKQR